MAPSRSSSKTKSKNRCIRNISSGKKINRCCEARKKMQNKKFNLPVKQGNKQQHCLYISEAATIVIWAATFKFIVLDCGLRSEGNWGRKREVVEGSWETVSSLSWGYFGLAETGESTHRARLNFGTFLEETKVVEM
ncbi:Uncharacterized protein Fot_23176 [Forsythia ovata]|uniref:Uncharacterized protein n=1 Tax=Forsythia ovata TaxID=205694 RepID=A0ABD1UZT0_9LAMI